MAFAKESALVQLSTMIRGDPMMQTGRNAMYAGTG